MKLRKGDEVLITSGKDKGKRGKIESTFPKKDTVVVGGLNLFKRHLKKRDEKNPGGILSIARPLSLAKVAIICPKCNKPTRLGITLAGKKKDRICRKCQQVI